MTEDLFSEFDTVSKAEWQRKIEQDLKGKPLRDLEWQLNEEIRLSPIHHREDRTGSDAPMIGQRRDNLWEITERIDVRVIKAANASALSALENGTQSIWFELNKECSELELALLLDQIQLDLISTHFSLRDPGCRPVELLQHFYDIVTKLRLDPSRIRGSLRLPGDPTKALQFTQQFLPRFRSLTIAANESLTDPQRRLTELLTDVQQQLIRYRTVYPTERIHQATQLHLPVGKSYFVEIATIRALHLLYANLLKANGLNSAGRAPILAYVHPSVYDPKEPYQNMIAMTFVAMAAVIGGVNQLQLAPADRESNTKIEVARRQARNVQHILQLESHFGDVIDPAAGSYYIEKLTDQLAERVWADLIKRQDTL